MSSFSVESFLCTILQLWFNENVLNHYIRQNIKRNVLDWQSI